MPISGGRGVAGGEAVDDKGFGAPLLGAGEQIVVPAADAGDTLGFVEEHLVAGERGFAFDLGGDVGAHGEKGDELSVFILNGLTLEFDPVAGAVAAAVAQGALEGTAVGDGVLDLPGENGIAVGGAKEVGRAASAGLVEGVAGDPGEGGVGPENPVVRIGDDGCVVSMLRHQGKHVAGRDGEKVRPLRSLIGGSH